MEDMIVDSDFIRAYTAFDDEDVVEFEILTEDTNAAVVSLILEIKELREFQLNAFLAYPNIDMDIGMLKPEKES